MVYVASRFPQHLSKTLITLWGLGAFRNLRKSILIRKRKPGNTGIDHWHPVPDSKSGCVPHCSGPSPYWLPIVSYFSRLLLNIVLANHRGNPTQGKSLNNCDSIAMWEITFGYSSERPYKFSAYEESDTEYGVRTVHRSQPSQNQHGAAQNVSKPSSGR